jgi:outer membrane protein OmpA-like peptidoglycan-associated protein
MSLNVPHEQIVVSSYGGSRALATEQNRWALNRRVELTVQIGD